MGRLLRLLMICLLALALPMQGVAAASRALCEGALHLPGQPAQALAPVHGHSHHTVSAQAGPAQHAMVAPGEGASADPGHALHKSSKPAPSSHADKHKCSACAACCSVGAILDAVMTVPPAEPSRTVFATVPSAVAAFAADGPDRPPRRRSA